jgi:integrase
LSQSRAALAWRKPRGYIADNPARNVGMIPRPRDPRGIHRAWTDHELIVVMNVAPELKLAIALGAYIGIREGDMLALPWSAYDGSWLRFKQGKTGTPLEIPSRRDLRPIIEITAKRSTIMATGARGRPFTGRRLPRPVFHADPQA